MNNQYYKKTRKSLALLLILSLIFGFLPMAVNPYGESKARAADTVTTGKVKQFFSEGDWSVAITENGDLYCWGQNTYGQIGNGTTEDQTVPVKVLENVKKVLTTYNRCAAITENGDLYCWGQNTYGQIGNGTTEEKQTVPVKVLENVKEVFDLYFGYSDRNYAVITENGDLYCWGQNTYGQIGNGTTEGQTVPVKVLENVKKVFWEKYNAVAITENGDLYCWGDNRYGQIGNGTTEDQTVPVKVLEKVKEVLLTETRSAAITENR